MTANTTNHSARKMNLAAALVTALLMTACSSSNPMAPQQDVADTGSGHQAKTAMQGAGEEFSGIESTRELVADPIKKRVGERDLEAGETVDSPILGGGLEASAHAKDEGAKDSAQGLDSEGDQEAQEEIQQDRPLPPTKMPAFQRKLLVDARQEDESNL